MKMGLKPTFYSHLVKNKPTFFSETFHFLPVYTFWFLIFFILAPKMHFVGFRFLLKKPKNLKKSILPPKSNFWSNWIAEPNILKKRTTEKTQQMNKYIQPHNKHHKCIMMMKTLILKKLHARRRKTRKKSVNNKRKKIGLKMQQNQKSKI